MEAIGRHIVDPRVLSEQVGDSSTEPATPTRATTTTDPIGPPGLPVNPRHNAVRRPNVDSMYSKLASYSFGEPACQADDDDGVSPLTPVTDITPRPSIVPPLQHVSSHPSQSSTYSGPPSTSEECDPRCRSPPTVFADDASYHTFGPGICHHDEPSSSSSVSIASSRPSSRTSFDSELISEDEVEIGTFSRDASPVTFANLPDIDEDPDLNAPIWCYTRSPLQGRKGSLPMAIPGALPDGSTRSREGSVLTVRRPSRSLDDEYGSHLTGIQDPTAITPKSEPHSRADWESIGAQIQAANAQAQASSEAQQPSPHPENVYNNLGFDLPYILQSKHSEGSIHSLAQYSFVQPSNPQPSGSSLSRFSAIAPFDRRSSTVTNSSEDAFTNLLRKQGTLSAIEAQWLYQCRKVEFPPKRKKGQHTRTPSNISLSSQPILNTDLKVLSKTMCVGQLEHWSCPNIGDFKVDRAVLEHEGKPDQHRLNVRHTRDSHSKNTCVGPSTLVHKHSRAIAFTIFRSFTLNNGQRAGTHITTSTGVMLASKMVQMQYTSTKTTRQLITHGLLDDSRGPKGGHGRMRDPNDNHKQPVPEETAKAASSKGKGKKKDKSLSSGDSNPMQYSPLSSQESASSRQTASMPAASSSRVQLIPRLRHATSQPVSLLAPVPLTDSVEVPESGGDRIQPPSPNRKQYGSGDSDEERVPARTPHAEALGALDAHTIEHYRSRFNRPNADSGASLTTRFLRVLRGPSRAAGVSPSVSVYRPPWIVTADREIQAENDRLINDLDKSFKDVGLLHTQPSKSSSKASSKRKVIPDVLADIPDDCLCMLLPLWVGEIDRRGLESDWSETSTATTALTLTVPENRYYLLVWYVPWADEKGKKPEQQVEMKKSKALPHTNDDSGVDAEPKPFTLRSFRVNARVVHYDELRHSGVRAPSTGLAINGPVWEAMNDLDFPAVRQDERTRSSVVCQCSGRNHGFSFDPHGLAQLGLCDVETSGPVSERDGDEEPTQTFSFTAIGKAAVEMIWLGCLAVTSFAD
ncbi:hypothetical protein SCLCIDRAFT_1208208 [Scleroderma citrinum Foug A]|uniref:Uncharacterized protein n=1 Tax=Scleroderma citrinum Foug A TaxID=1036808 RepID=A0A0C3EAF7_9AGAM|nr:hypothetical protein SCLCIDRAFT_1208208 [Scleroderma citrinum Foug A]